MAKRSTILSVSAEEDDLVAQDTIFNALHSTMHKLSVQDLDFNFSSYKDEKIEITPKTLVDWEEELLASRQIDPNFSDRMGVARTAAADMLNDVTALNYPSTDFNVQSFVVNDDGWVAYVFLPSRPDNLFVVTRNIKREEIIVQFMKTYHSCVINT